ncbi:MAG: hypothetical protein QW835_06225 [Candidatus Hadarchaeum sp.]
MKKITKNTFFMIALLVIFILLSGCGEDPTKLPPDELLGKVFQKMAQKGGAFEVKETMVLGAGTSNALTLNTDGIIEPTAKAAYLVIKDMPEKGTDMNIYYNKDAKDTYIKLIHGPASMIFVSQKNMTSELSFATIEKLLSSMQDPKKLAETKVKVEGDQLILEGTFNSETLNYLQLEKAALKYAIDRKTLGLQRIDVSFLNILGGQTNASYTFRPGLNVPTLSEEEKAKAIRQ